MVGKTFERKMEDGGGGMLASCGKWQKEREIISTGMLLVEVFMGPGDLT